MLEYLNIHGINTYLNPVTSDMDGQLLSATNVISYPYGGKSKRPGYSTFLGTFDGAQVNSLLAFPMQDGTTLWLYRASGSQLSYSQQGTGAWTLAANGTITNGNHFGAAVLNNTFIGGDGAGSTRHTTDGTTFTNTSNAPISNYFAQYQDAIYASGTTSTLFFSTAGDATNWSVGGTSTASSLIVPDEGKLSQIFVTADKLIATKNRGKMFQWDGNALVDLSTRYGPSSPWSIADIEDYRFYVNQFGHFGFDRANNIQLLSNPIQNLFYNRNNTGIAGTTFPTIPAACHIYDYFASIGTVQDSFTGRGVNNAILNYNYQKNEYLLWQFYDFPTAWLSYFDTNNKRQLIFGNASGQCFQLDPTKASDNGSPIQTEMVYIFSYALQSQQFSQTSASAASGVTYQKKWDWITLYFNPGDEVNIQYAFADTLTYQHLKWSEAISLNNRNGDYYQVSDGVVEIRFPRTDNNPPRSRFLFLRIYDNSESSQWTYYGCRIEATPITEPFH